MSDEDEEFRFDESEFSNDPRYQPDQWADDVPPGLLPREALHYRVFIFGTCLLAGYIAAIVLASNGRPWAGIAIGTIIAATMAHAIRGYLLVT